MCVCVCVYLCVCVCVFVCVYVCQTTRARTHTHTRSFGDFFFNFFWAAPLLVVMVLRHFCDAEVFFFVPWQTLWENTFYNRETYNRCYGERWMLFIYIEREHIYRENTFYNRGTYNRCYGERWMLFGWSWRRIILFPAPSALLVSLRCSLGFSLTPHFFQWQDNFCWRLTNGWQKHTSDTKNQEPLMLLCAKNENEK